MSPRGAVAWSLHDFWSSASAHQQCDCKLEWLHLSRLARNLQHVADCRARLWGLLVPMRASSGASLTLMELVILQGDVAAFESFTADDAAGKKAPPQKKDAAKEQPPDEGEAAQKTEAKAGPLAGEGRAPPPAPARASGKSLVHTAASRRTCRLIADLHTFRS